MKTTDLNSRGEKVAKVMRYILNKKPHNEKVYGGASGPYVKIFGKELSEKFDYDFIQDKLEITIFYNKKAMLQPWQVSEYWGNKVRIDIIGLDEDGNKISKTKVKEYLKNGFNEYLDLISNERHTYDSH